LHVNGSLSFLFFGREIAKKFPLNSETYETKTVYGGKVSSYKQFKIEKLGFSDVYAWKNNGL